MCENIYDVNGKPATLDRSDEEGGKGSVESLVGQSDFSFRITLPFNAPTRFIEKQWNTIYIRRSLSTYFVHIRLNLGHIWELQVPCVYRFPSTLSFQSDESRAGSECGRFESIKSTQVDKANIEF